MVMPLKMMSSLCTAFSRSDNDFARFLLSRYILLTAGNGKIKSISMLSQAIDQANIALDGVTYLLSYHSE